ncbi:MAG: class I SAM-dependent methyltransferase [Rhodococcus sp. (in: high G+C Gram-positive bacteria)]
MTLAQAIEILTNGQLPLRFTAYDGSAAGPKDASLGLHLKTPRGTTYLATAPGELGLVRAYLSGDLELKGVHPGDPYELLHSMAENLKFYRPPAKTLIQIVRSIGPGALRPIAPPSIEIVPRWRRLATGLLHSKHRDADAIHHHYDVSDQFYRYVLGPSMAYTCAVYPSLDSSLEEAQENKYRLVFDKLGLKPGDRLLDIGCGWGVFVRYAARRGVNVVGATLAREQAEWAQKAIAEEGLSDRAEVRFTDYRDIQEKDFDAISSMGMTEHIGVQQYPTYFGFFHDKLRPGGRMLNHSVTRIDNTTKFKGGPFTDRYVFPDGELTGSGRIISEIQNAGLEVLHEENLREHYATTLRDWCRNLVDNWDDAVAEVGEENAKIWGLFMAGGRVRFDRNYLQLHQVLAVKTPKSGNHGLPLGQWWNR